MDACNMVCEWCDLGDSVVNADAVGNEDSGQKYLGHRVPVTYTCMTAREWSVFFIFFIL